MDRRSLTLELVPGDYAVCRLAADATSPTWAKAGSFVSLTRTRTELSVVCQQELVPSDVPAERGWRCLRVKGPLDFGMVGVLASLATPLAASGVSIFVVSTYDTDYLMVRSSDVEQACHALEVAGHTIEGPPA